MPNCASRTRPRIWTARSLRGPVLLAVVCATASGCKLTPWDREVMFSRDGLTLYRESLRPPETPLDLRHPIHLPGEKAAGILAQLAFRSDPLFGSSEDRLIFTAEEVARFSEPIALALRTLEPDTRLRFLVMRSRWHSSLTGPKAISGVVFMETDGQLEVAFDRIVDKVVIGDNGSPEDVSFHVEPTSDQGTDDPLIPFPGSRLHVDPKTGKRFARWLEIDIAALRPPVAEAVATPTSSPPAGAAPDDPVAPKPEPAIAAPSVAPAPPPVPTEPADDSEYARLKNRLALLKRLREDGAITEEEYEEQFERAMRELDP